MKKRRLLAPVLLLLIIVCLLGNAKKPAEPVKLVLWCWDPAFNGAAMNEAAKLYHEKYPNVTVDVQVIGSSDVRVKFQTAITAKQWDLLPDIYLTQDRDLDKNQSLYNIFEDLTKSGIRFSRFSPSKVEAASSQGKIYGVPFDNQVACFAFRNDLLKQAGFTVKDITDITWDRFMEIGRVVKQKLNIPMVSNRTDAGFMLIEMMMQSAGTWYFDKQGKVSVTDDPVFREALDLYLQMVKEGIIKQVSDGPQFNAALYNGSVMGAVFPNWILTTIAQEKSLSGKWNLTNVPRLVKAKGATNYTTSGGCNWNVVNKSKHKAEAIDFLKETVGGGSLADEFYGNILGKAGVIGSYLPAERNKAYQVPSQYYSGQKIYADLVAYSKKVPKVSLGWYTIEARLASATAVQRILSGTPIEEALKEMKATVEFQMAK